MNPTVLVALIGAAASIIVALITTRRPKTDSPPPKVGRTSFAAILAVGLSLTGIAIGVTSLKSPQLRVISNTYAACTAGQSADPTIPAFLARNVPQPPKKYPLPMECPSGYKPIAAWHEITGGHPSAETMYGVEASVEDDHIFLSLRARKDYSGYSYVRVMALCSRVD